MMDSIASVLNGEDIQRLSRTSSLLLPAFPHLLDSITPIIPNLMKTVIEVLLKIP